MEAGFYEHHGNDYGYARLTSVDQYVRNLNDASYALHEGKLCLYLKASSGTMIFVQTHEATDRHTKIEGPIN
jgi:hypothetical protein